MSPYWELCVRLNLCYAWTPCTLRKDGYHGCNIAPIGVLLHPILKKTTKMQPKHISIWHESRLRFSIDFQARLFDRKVTDTHSTVL